MARRTDDTIASQANPVEFPKINLHASGASTTGAVAMGVLDMRGLRYALGAGAGYFGLAMLCLWLSRFDAALASIWLPNASAVAMLLIVRLRNEVPAYGAIGVASIIANLVSGTPTATTFVFTLANMFAVLTATWLTRRSCGHRPNMTDINHLGRFLLFGGIVSPLVSAAVAAFAFALAGGSIWAGASAWFLAECMGMILTVPAILLIADAFREKATLTRAELLERTALILGGLATVFFVFKQDIYPLLFLIPPVTLLIAFRLGGLGTALYVPAVAIVTSIMTYSGVGPIVNNSSSEISTIYLIQAVVVANFLTGLPIAAILAGRARMTEELATGRQELALLTENVTDAVMWISKSGVCTYASPSVRDVLGREPADLVGFNVTERTHEDAQDRITSTLGKLQEGVTDKERFTYRRLHDAEDGTPVFIEADCSVAIDPETGRKSGIVVSARDVTERVELELLLTRARRHAENAARAKSEFLANMSHEIRTPMNGVLGFAELILQDDLEDEHRHRTEMIVQSGRSMMMLLNDILDLSKIEAGQIAIDKEPVDLYATISECAMLHRPTAQKKGVELNFHFGAPDQGATETDGQTIAEDQHPWVTTDGLRLRQIILNLVGNAVKFTERGHIQVSYWAEQDNFYVEVSDTGIGISSKRLQTIFAPFTQGENDTARRFGGTGLGLTISRQLAGLLGGDIEVHSEPGAGSKFRLRLPADYAEPQEKDVYVAERVEPADLPQSARVLLVEDHDVNRLLGTEMLERCGQSVAIAHDGNEAIAMVIDSVMRGNPYDLVLMDIQMPGCDGYAATRAIRAEGIGPDVMPIVALTANAFPEDIAAARDSGMQAHLAKPLVFADLARALQRWLPTRIVESEPNEHDPQPANVSRQSFGSARQAAEAVSLNDERDAAIEEPRDAPPEQEHRLQVGGHKSTERGARRSGAHAGATPVSAAHSEAEGQTTGMPQNHSPALLGRWRERRGEAIEAVRDALEDGSLGDGTATNEASEELARLVHKLAGTAAIFGEPELGDQAAKFERALRTQECGTVQETLAFELLSVADDPADRRRQD